MALIDLVHIVKTYDLGLEKVHALADISHSSGYKLPISVGGQYVFTTLVSGALWVEEYHHVPMTEVMVDQSDYEQPLKVGIQPI